ncbi:balbiani ring protein 3-like [Monomorium pharaonis]|uniref:balbiani ring protein 3-like n=1 Tax=Monomorium pharaonis TaxID=307658 RepID=UPI001747CDAB|nr:balbiani ring protein 3-like [Monomorium pharaonis]
MYPKNADSFSLQCFDAGSNCASDRRGCEALISSCNCQSNVGCLDRCDGACGGLQHTGTAETGACPGPCQCAEEKLWNSNVPPKPNCQWLNNFAELRRQWSDHGRQQTYKCRGCGRRPWQNCRFVSPTVSFTSGPVFRYRSTHAGLSDDDSGSGAISCAPLCNCRPDSSYLQQKCCGSRRLAGGASKSEIAPADKSSSPEPVKREAGGGCPPPSCSYSSTRYNSPSADGSTSTVASSCCPSQCRHQASSQRASDCQPCALKSILKKRSCCCQRDASRCCTCQPMPRGCNCPPPIQVDARASRECSCECPSGPECTCPPSERRFPKATVKCPNARRCCPSPRLPPGPKCHCPRCQPCPPCGPCTSSNYRQPVPPKDVSCRPGTPCPFCPPCRSIATASPCRPPTPCGKLTFCTERSGRPFSPCTGQSWRGIIGDKDSESSIYGEQNDDDERRETIRDKKDRHCCHVADCARSERGIDEIRDLILNERSTQCSPSKTFINLSETTNPAESVDPDSRNALGESDETAFKNTAETFDGCTTEKSSKDSWYTSPTHIPSDSGTKPDCYALHGEYPPAGGNVSGNPASASHVKSFSRVRDLSASNKTPLRRSVTFRETPLARVEIVGGCFNRHPDNDTDM